MHAAPSVTYPVGRSALAAILSALLAGAGALAATAWSWQSPAAGWRQALAWSAVVAAALVATAAWLRSPVGTLRWDGAEWTWEEGSRTVAGQPEIALDLQSHLLLRWRGPGRGSRWLWLERKSDQSHWDALRRAVYSRAGTPMPQAGRPPAEQ